MLPSYLALVQVGKTPKSENKTKAQGKQCRKNKENEPYTHTHTPRLLLGFLDQDDLEDYRRQYQKSRTRG